MSTIYKLLLFLVIEDLLLVGVWGEEQADTKIQQLYTLTRNYTGQGVVSDDESLIKDSDILIQGENDNSVEDDDLVVYIRCKKCKIDQIFIDKIAEFKNLQVLVFENCSYDPRTEFSFHKISKLKSLSFSYSHAGLPANLCEHCRDCKNLKELMFFCFDSSQVSFSKKDGGIQPCLPPQQIFVDISSNTSIRLLTIIADEKRLRLLGTRMKITELNLTGSTLTLPMAELLHNFSKLEVLVLGGIGDWSFDTGKTVTDDFIKMISDISLKRLWIPGNSLTDNSVPVLMNWTSLEACSYHGWGVTDKGRLQLSKKFGLWGEWNWVE